MTTFYGRIGNAYGNVVVKSMKIYSNANRSLASQKNRVIFLLECKRHKLSPKFITDSTRRLWNVPQRMNSRNANSMEFLTNQVANKLHKVAIYETNRYINTLNNKINNALLTIRELVPFHIVDSFLYYQNKTFNNIFNQVKKRNINKLKQLIKNRDSFFSYKNEWFKNVSDVDIPQNVQGFLALGPKFGLPVSVKDIDIYKLLAEVELLIQSTPQDRQNLVRSKATNAITNYIHANAGFESPCSELERVTSRFLKNNPELLITRSDKGNVTVAMNKSTYIEKSLELLNDESTYGLFHKDPTTLLENSCNKLIKELKDKGYLDAELAKSLIGYRGVCPRYYGLPKIHKEGTPLRPIVSCVGASTQPLAKHISSILDISFSSFNKFRIRDVFQFAENINNFQLPDNFVLASFDVVSLFTNIPLDLIVSILNEHFNLIKDNCQIPQSTFIKIITYLYNNTFFSFNGNFYKQKVGVPMGGATSPIIAEIVMNKLLYYVTQQADFQFPFLFQYVDDLLLALPVDKVTYTLNIFNSFNSNLKFTIEEEIDRAVPFLDTRVVRSSSNTIMLDWYRKKTSSGRYIPFQSYHPMKQKFNTILAMKNRVKKICHPQFWDKNLKLLEKIFLDNNYPISMIRKTLLSEYRPTNIHLNNSNLNSNVELKYFKLQYVRGLSDKLSSLFKTPNVRIASYNLKKIGQFSSKIKDRIPVLERSNVIYGITCQCDQIYIGQTSQKLSKRLALHKSDCRLKPTVTSLAKHVNQMDHRVKYDEAFVLDTEQNIFKRKFLEMCHINSCANCLNCKKDIEDLSSIYTYLLTQNLTKPKKTDASYIRRDVS